LNALRIFTGMKSFFLTLMTRAHITEGKGQGLSGDYWQKIKDNMRPRSCDRSFMLSFRGEAKGRDLLNIGFKLFDVFRYFFFGIVVHAGNAEWYPCGFDDSHLLKDFKRVDLLVVTKSPAIEQVCNG